jgi:hypothetical protein
VGCAEEAKHGVSRFIVRPAPQLRTVLIASAGPARLTRVSARREGRNNGVFVESGTHKLGPPKLVQIGLDQIWICCGAFKLRSQLRLLVTGTTMSRPQIAFLVPDFQLATMLLAHMNDTRN